VRREEYFTAQHSAANRFFRQRVSSQDFRFSQQLAAGQHQLAGTQGFLRAKRWHIQPLMQDVRSFLATSSLEPLPALRRTDAHKCQHNQTRRRPLFPAEFCPRGDISSTPIVAQHKTPIRLNIDYSSQAIHTAQVIDR